MARIRNIKPAFFKDSELYDAEAETGLPLRVAYAGLWTVADRAGRFKWKPREIKTDVLPYDDCNMGAVLDALVKAGKIFKYKSGGLDYGFILNFEKHQFINRNEVASQLPEPPTNIPEYSKIVSSDEYTGGLDTDTDGKTQTVSTPAKAVVSKPVTVRGTRWPSDRKVPEPWIASVIERFRELGRPPPDLRLEAVKFANYWAAKSGKDATKLDWEKTFLNWCINARSTDQRSFAERKFDALKSGASDAAFVDTGRGQGVESPSDNLVRLAIPHRAGG